MKKIAILGSTGSIGTQTLDVVSHFQDKIEVCGLSTNSRIDILYKQIEKFKPKKVCITDKTARTRFNYKKYSDCKVFSDLEIFIEDLEIDLLITAVVGSAGLIPTLKAIEKGTNIALANKETLVMAGQFVMEKAKQNNINIFPIDSEHSAIWQSLRGNSERDIENIWITCSGGPFVGKNRDFLKEVSIEDALNHPTWSMGGKITIDSSTLMNKGLEVIEAYHLFDVEINQIKVFIHPQSIIHSIVEYSDGNYISQMGAPDMRIPIQYAIFHPNRYPNKYNKLNLLELKDLTFDSPDLETFTPLALAYDALKQGGIMPAVLNAGNEILVSNFLKGQIKFIDILEQLEHLIYSTKNTRNPSIEDIIQADREARVLTQSLIDKK